MKRCIDLILAIILLISLSPLFIIISFMIYFKLGSPIIFKQLRPGYKEKPFYLYKFRSMTDLRDENGNLLPDEMRLTPFGLWIRNYSIDELPQLINVLKGDISLVGPRPLLMEYLPLYNSEQAKRHLVRPGITGWVQVNGRNQLSWEERFKLDVWYVENQSLWLDIKIMFLTLKKVLKKEGIHHKGHATMYNFTGNEQNNEGIYKRIKIVDTVEEWNEKLAAFKHLDVFYCYKYTQLFAKDEQGEAKAAFYENDDTKIFYPFILRDISILDKKYKDIVTPYGYGGPYIEGSKQEIKNFYDHFSEYCKENNIVTETVRLHPLYDNKEYVKEVLDIRYIGESIAVDLEEPYKDIWKSYSKNNQRNIDKAKESGMSVEIVPKTTANIETFHHLYESTMKRKNAAEMYYFSKEFFCELLTEDVLYESFLLFVHYQNKVVAGLILLIGKEFAHYQFGGSHNDYLHLRPNNLLFDYMIRFCQEKGAKFLHLGGGHQENGGLYRFKSSFANCPYHSYYLGTKIYNQMIYDQLNEITSSYDSFNQNFFPPYRSVLSK